MKTTKRISILLFLSVLVFYGCTQDKGVVQPEESQGLIIGVANQKGEVISAETITREESFNFPPKQNRSGNLNQIVTGDYTRGEGSTVELSAILNNGGMHGDLELHSNVLGEFFAESLCVSTYEDGIGIVGYHIQSVEFPSGVWDAGTIFYWKYKDNGEGINDPKDETSENVYYLANWQNVYSTPEEAILDWPCDSFVDLPEWGGWIEIVSGNIQVQHINANQTDENLIRGTLVTIPLFDENPIEVPVGKWATIAFSYQAIVNLGNCQGPLTEAQINDIMADALLFTENEEVEISFDGAQIDVFSNFREDAIITVNNNSGNCQYILPWRYYVNPQSPGVHTLSFNFSGGDYSRNVIWVLD